MPSFFREFRVNPGYPEKPRRCQDSGDVRVSRDSFRYRSIFSFSQRCVETVLKLPEVNLGSPHSVLGQGQSALGLSQVEIRLSQANQSAPKDNSKISQLPYTILASNKQPLKDAIKIIDG